MKNMNGEEQWVCNCYEDYLCERCDRFLSENWEDIDEDEVNNIKE
jgi:hypothetical protein